MKIQSGALHRVRAPFVYRISLLIIAASLTTACASAVATAPESGSVASAPAPRAASTRGSAQLTLTRVSGLMYSGAPATVKINGEQVANLWAGSSTTVPLAAGANSITVEAFSYPGQWTVDLNAKPGANHTLEISPRGDSLGPSMLLGPLGGAIDASANKNAGAFQMRVVR